MNMFRDMQGMKPLKQAGLPAMIESGKTDPAVVARVVNLIVNDPALPQADQLSSNGVNEKPFSLERNDFSAARNQDLRWRISEGSDLMLHPVHVHGCQFRIISRDGKPPEAERAGWKDIAPISAGGVSLVLNRGMEPDTMLTVQLLNRPRMFFCKVEVKVTYVVEHPSGDWILGGSFARRLSDEELRSLLAKD